jgi:hypothetical protein
LIDYSQDSKYKEYIEHYQKLMDPKKKKKNSLADRYSKGKKSMTGVGSEALAHAFNSNSGFKKRHESV